MCRVLALGQFQFSSRKYMRVAVVEMRRLRQCSPFFLSSTPCKHSDSPPDIAYLFFGNRKDSLFEEDTYSGNLDTERDRVCDFPPLSVLTVFSCTFFSYVKLLYTHSLPFIVSNSTWVSYTYIRFEFVQCSIFTSRKTLKILPLRMLCSYTAAVLINECIHSRDEM